VLHEVILVFPQQLVQVLGFLQLSFQVVMQPVADDFRGGLIGHRLEEGDGVFQDGQSGDKIVGEQHAHLFMLEVQRNGHGGHVLVELIEKRVSERSLVRLDAVRFPIVQYGDDRRTGVSRDTHVAQP